MGYGFVDVFNAIGGLVSDVFYKADPKKSDVKNYFDSIASILKETQTKLDALSKEQGGGDGGTQVVDAAGAAEGKGAAQAANAVEAAIGDDDAGQAGAAFGAGMQNKNDQIAAAIVLRGLAKGGKFANE
ncbi:variable large family protein, partial [Borreliella garinii]|uniref:variable large family protein n=2 Tax=Borreliella garinii TaxID=29519 RepID=UPI003AF69E21